MSDNKPFYILIQCPSCDEEIHYGPVASFHEHRGLMSVPFDMLSQTRVDCDECDATIWFGDFDDAYLVEGGEDDDAEEAS